MGRLLKLTEGQYLVSLEDADAAGARHKSCEVKGLGNFLHGAAEELTNCGSGIIGL